MELSDLAALIGLSPDVLERARGVLSDEELLALRPAIARLRTPESAGAAYSELCERLSYDPDGMKMLRCQLECALGTYEMYLERRIPEGVFAATMGCFSRFINECVRRTGSPDFDRGWWTYRQLSLQLFRLGELEYELKEYDGLPAAAIHIPSDADLSTEAVDRSLTEADIFFRSHFGPRSAYTCRSWLLSPSLIPLLGENSNILSFQRHFDIKSRDLESREFVQWLFYTSPDTPVELFEERTSLQRAVKGMLLAGGSLGSAFGVLRR